MMITEHIMTFFKWVYAKVEKPKTLGTTLILDLSPLPNRKHLLLAIFKDGVGFPDDIVQAVSTQYIEDGAEHYPFRFSGLEAGCYSIVLHTEPDYKGEYQNIFAVIPKEKLSYYENELGNAEILNDCIIKIDKKTRCKKIKITPLTKPLVLKE